MMQSVVTVFGFVFIGFVLIAAVLGGVCVLYGVWREWKWWKTRREILRRHK